MKKESLPKPITILILTLLTALVWVGLGIYRAISVKPPTPVPEEVLKPLNPTLNTKVIQKIESAIFIPDSEIPQMSFSGPTSTVQTPTTETPLPSATPEASPSGLPEQ
ncbi:MAG: hypothetical protein ACD_13C00093G0010 [uncultured bacterium]|nr:MAG: hypothetical protein ACD_13C00093G0010 [uncultured bacterium]